MEFFVENQPCFEIPLQNVSNCTVGKNEAALEFHQNDDCAVSLMELRFHIPTDNAQNDDPVEVIVDEIFICRKMFLLLCSIQRNFVEISCAKPVSFKRPEKLLLCWIKFCAPHQGFGHIFVSTKLFLRHVLNVFRGRYDIKIYPTFLALHGKTFDYKIPISTILRLFLLPHRDGRRMFFVVRFLFILTLTKYKEKFPISSDQFRPAHQARTNALSFFDLRIYER